MTGVTILGTNGTNVMTFVAFLDEVACAAAEDDPICKLEGDMVQSASLTHVGQVGH